MVETKSLQVSHLDTPQISSPEENLFFLSSDSEKLFWDFFDQKEGQSLYDILWMTSQFIRTEEEQSLLKRYFVGSLANDLFNMVHARNHPEFTMLQDTQMLDYLRTYFPKSKEIRYPLKLNTYKSLFVPDAIGLSGEEDILLFENTLVKEPNALIDRLKHKSRLLKDLRKHHKAIFGTSPLIVGLTEDNYQANAKQIRSLAGVEPVAMPFQTREIVLLADWLFYQYIPEGSSYSIADICSESIEEGEVDGLVSLEIGEGITASLQEKEWRYILGLAGMIRAAAA